jgi:pimeloyl-ACP methyl ester carboxylesterase
MKKRGCLVLVLLLVFSLCLGGLAQAKPLPDQSDAYSKYFSQALSKAGGSIQSGISRKQLAADVYEYSLVVRVGPGAHDKIGLHRVAAEKAPWVPVPASKAVFLIHGDNSSFDASFATLSPDQQSLAIYLAQQGVDVWGIDLRWVLVPDGTTDLSFMKNWNTALHLKDIKIAVQIARTVRGLTGSGLGKIFLLGHSRGAQLTYAYANQDAQLPSLLQDLKGIIPVDFAYKLDPNDPAAQAIKQAAETRYATLQAAVSSGVYHSDDGATLKGIAYLAATEPDAPSPANPALTNLQFAIAALTATYAAATPELPAYTPYFHNLAGTFDPATGLPTGLQFADPGHVLNLGLATPSFQSLGEILDGDAIASGVPGPYDNRLGKIRIPVFYVGAGGGAGQFGAYTLTLLGGSDKESLIVSTYPDPPFDYGHVDLLWAGNARDLAWEPISGWIAER